MSQNYINWNNREKLENDLNYYWPTDISKILEALPLPIEIWIWLADTIYDLYDTLDRTYNLFRLFEIFKSDVDRQIKTP